MTVIGMVAAMSRGRRSGSRVRRRPVSVDERAAAVGEYRESVGRFQSAAYRNLRVAIANATIFLAVISAAMILTGGATTASLIPLAVAVIGGAIGASTHLVRAHPLARYLLITAAVLSVLGLVGLILVTQAVDR
jgi:hypothetical protein